MTAGFVPAAPGGCGQPEKGGKSELAARRALAAVRRFVTPKTRCRFLVQPIFLLRIFHYDVTILAVRVRRQKICVGLLCRRRWRWSPRALWMPKDNAGIANPSFIPRFPFRRWVRRKFNQPRTPGPITRGMSPLIRRSESARIVSGLPANAGALIRAPNQSALVSISVLRVSFLPATCALGRGWGRS